MNDFVHRHISNVMPVMLVLCAGITQANQQEHDARLFFRVAFGFTFGGFSCFAFILGVFGNFFLDYR